MKKLIIIICIIAPLFSFCQSDITKKILETWDTHCKMNYYMLDSVQEKYLNDTLCSGGRTVLQDFIHVNWTRIIWLQQMTGKDLKKHLLPETATHSEVSITLKTTDKLVRDFLSENINTAIKAFNGNVIDFMGYLISHESHSRGQIILAFKQSGHLVSAKIQYGIWKW